MGGQIDGKLRLPCSSKSVLAGENTPFRLPNGAEPRYRDPGRVPVPLDLFTNRTDEALRKHCNEMARKQGVPEDEYLKEMLHFALQLDRNDVPKGEEEVTFADDVVVRCLPRPPSQPLKVHCSWMFKVEGPDKTKRYRQGPTNNDLSCAADAVLMLALFMDAGLTRCDQLLLERYPELDVATRTLYAIVGKRWQDFQLRELNEMRDKVVRVWILPPDKVFRDVRLSLCERLLTCSSDWGVSKLQRPDGERF